MGKRRDEEIFLPMIHLSSAPSSQEDRSLEFSQPSHMGGKDPLKSLSHFFPPSRVLISWKLEWEVEPALEFKLSGIGSWHPNQ